MSYRFRVGESLEAGVQRIARERIDGALAALNPGDGASADVHEARKRFKEIRALLRLVRQPLGATARAENAFFRDLGRRLSGARDAEAMIETVDRLIARFPRALGKARYRSARAALEARQTATGVGLDGELAAVCAELHEARSRVAGWRLDGDGFQGIAVGLHKAYRDGRRGMARAYATAADEAFHEWRKRIKDQWYHIKLLRRCWAPVMAARQGELKALSDLIGNEHDLTVLCQTVETEPEAVGDAELGEGLAILARRQQSELRAQARPLGLRLYAEKPGAFRRRMGAYWQAWAASADDQV